MPQPTQASRTNAAATSVSNGPGALSTGIVATSACGFDIGLQAGFPAAIPQRPGHQTQRGNSYCRNAASCRDCIRPVGYNPYAGYPPVAAHVSASFRKSTGPGQYEDPIGRASCRERVCQYV